MPRYLPEFAILPRASIANTGGPTKLTINRHLTINRFLTTRYGIPVGIAATSSPVVRSLANWTKPKAPPDSPLAPHDARSYIKLTILPIIKSQAVMMSAATLVVLLFGAVLGAVVALTLRSILDRRRTWRDRAYCEDVLRYLLICAHRGQRATPDTLAKTLGMSRPAANEIIARMQTGGLLSNQPGRLQLSPQGERWALHVMRAHRLWERYLTDEANLPIDQVHRAAHRAEHDLSMEQVEALDAHLGHPRLDPHGEPIPSASGELASIKTTPLADWPLREPARIVAVAEEPELIARQIAAEGLHPGTVVRVLEKRDDRLVVSDRQTEHRLAPEVARSIRVAPLEVDRLALPDDAIPLSEVPTGREAEVIAIDDGCRGLRRRRLLDLGLTAGAVVRPELQGPFGDSRAFLIRGTLIALRKEEADQIWVRLAPEAAAIAS